MPALLQVWFEKLLEIIFPKEILIAKLEELAKKEGLGSLPLADEPPATFINPLFNYQDHRIRTLVWAIKYRGNKFLAGEAGKLLYEAIVEDLGETVFFENSRKVVIVPVPLSRKRFLERGFNQTELLCAGIVLADSNKIFSYKADILIKTLGTPPQTSLRRSERLKNLSGCFEIKKPEAVRDKFVILIDDVSTTGSTLREARKTLLAAGAKKVLAFVIAH
jgi:ComF family protein